MTSHFLIGIIGIGIGIDPAQRLTLTFLYQAIQRQAYLVAHSEGIAIDGEVGICLQLLEVEADAAIFPSC